MNKLLKRTMAGLTGLAAVGGATAVAVSCGASQKVYPFKVYSYSFQSSPISANLRGNELRLWVPFEYDPQKTTDRYYPLARAVIQLLEKNNYKVTVVDASEGVNYGQVANTYDRFATQDKTLLPDVMINYPDLQALLVENELAQPFDLTLARSRITQALQFDITSPLAPKEDAYALPISKSTELTYFNVPAFSMVLNDIAAQRNSTEKINFPAGSAQARMAKMIKNAATKNSNLHQDIYKEPSVDEEYSWSEFKTYWGDLTKAGGLWEADKKALTGKYTLVDQVKLLDFDLSTRLFENYIGLGNYVKSVGKAYSFNTNNNVMGILGIDSPTNTVYAYQYDVAGHTPDNFIITVDKKASPPKLSFDYRDSITEGTGVSQVTKPSATYQAFSYLSDLQASKSLFIRDQSAGPYTVDLLQKHDLFLAWQSSSGVSSAAASDDKKELLNNGEVYFDYQPTKAGIPNETDRKTVINQGPSIMVSKAHPEESKKIADLIIEEFKAGGAFTAKIDANGVDQGVFGGKGGYIYADTDDYKANSPYLQSLSTLVASSSNWSSNIGKYLLSSHYAKSAASTTASQYDAFANPAGRGTSPARNQIDQAYLTANVNNGSVSAAEAMQRVLRTLVPDFRLT